MILVYRIKDKLQLLIKFVSAPINVNSKNSVEINRSWINENAVESKGR